MVLLNVGLEHDIDVAAGTAGSTPTVQLCTYLTRDVSNDYAFSSLYKK